MKKLLFLILIDLFFFACKPDKSCERKDEIIYENIPDSNTSQIPYKGNEHLSFVNETGDTAVFKCTGYNNYYSTEKKAEGSNGCTYWVITKTQQIDFTFIDTANENRNFRVKYEAEYPSLLEKPFISIYFYSPSEFKISMRDLDFFYNPIHFDSLVLVSGKVIHGSYMNKDLGIFYSLENGINSFTDQFQNKWTLLK